MGARLAAPRAPSMRLDDLATGYPGDLGAGDRVDALSFTDLDLTGVSLSGSTLSECDIDGLRGADVDLRGGRLLESRIRRADVPVFRAPRSTWRDVLIEHGRLGSAELYDADWTAVRFVGCKLGFVNLRGATITDAVFEDCRIDELDLGGARVRRTAFPGSTISVLAVQSATFADTDLRGADFHEISGVESLRGATVDGDQLTLLAPLLASSMGLRIED